MNSKHFLMVVMAAGLAALTQATFAQSIGPTSRADMKTQTRAAEAAHELVPAGEGIAASTEASTGHSTKTRTEQKAETRAAREAGGLAAAGEEPAGAKAEKSIKSTKTRAEGKAEARAAEKEGTVPPAGEGAKARKK